MTTTYNRHDYDSQACCADLQPQVDLMNVTDQWSAGHPERRRYPIEGAVIFVDEHHTGNGLHAVARDLRHLADQLAQEADTPRALTGWTEADNQHEPMVF